MLAFGLPGDYAKDADDLARKVWLAKSRGVGCRLTPDMVVALDQLMADGDWWQSFDPLNKEEGRRSSSIGEGD